jgi:hypothetical protein
MSEPSPEDHPHVSPRRSDFLVAITRMEAKLDVALAQQQARLDEHGRAIAEGKAATARLETRVGVVEQKQAATDAVDRSKAPPQPWTTYVSIGISLLLALYIVIGEVTR